MRKYLRGRTNRATFWALYLAMVALYAGAVLIASKPPAIGELLLILLAVPRLHDIGLTGWLAGIPVAAELLVVGALFSNRLSVEDTQIAAGVIVLGTAALLALLGAIPGNPNANRFGEPPAPGINMQGQG